MVRFWGPGLLVLFLISCASAPAPVTQGAVVSVVCARDFDPKRKVVFNVTSTFQTSDRQVVLGVTLKGYPPGARCQVVRYQAGKFVDHGSVPVRKPSGDTVFFTWPLSKPGVDRTPGLYKVKVFVNGRFVRETSYTVN